MDLPNGVVAGRCLRLNNGRPLLYGCFRAAVFCHLAYDADRRHNEDTDERMSDQNAVIEAANPNEEKQ